MASNITITVRYTESSLIEKGAVFESFEAFQKHLIKLQPMRPKAARMTKSDTA
jgi:hypothetical protein